MLLYFKQCSRDGNTKPREAWEEKGEKREKITQQEQTPGVNPNPELPVQNYNSQRSRGGKSGSSPAQSLLPEVTRDPRLVPAPGDSPAPAHSAVSGGNPRERRPQPRRGGARKSWGRALEGDGEALLCPALEFSVVPAKAWHGGSWGGRG